MEKAVWVWLAAAIVFVALEIFTPAFIFACFVVGALAAGATTFITDSLVIQGLVFAVVSIILIPLTRPLAKKITKPSPVITNVDGLIGKTGYVKKEVSDTAGQVIVDDQVWQARSEKVIPVDKKVKILSVAGAKLKVEEA